MSIPRGVILINYFNLDEFEKTLNMNIPRRDPLFEYIYIYIYKYVLTRINEEK